MSEATLALEVSYHGAPFCGFARQRDVRNTVQEDIERALEVLFRREVPTTCAGRTDAGVHARGQWVSFDVDEDELAGRSLVRLGTSLNAITHRAVRIKRVEERPFGWSARFDAKAREYRYFIAREAAPPVFMVDFSWHLPGDLDVAAMERASRCLIGEHDFKSFCMAASAVGKPTHRNVSEITIYPESVMGEDLLIIKVVGNAFLHSMVRTIVGTLVAVGRGQRDPEWVADVLAACDRSAAGENAPACGLTFWQVRY